MTLATSMYTSFSRGTSRVANSYICSSCLYSLRKHPGIYLPRYTSPGVLRATTASFSTKLPHTRSRKGQTSSLRDPSGQASYTSVLEGENNPGELDDVPRAAPNSDLSQVPAPLSTTKTKADDIAQPAARVKNDKKRNLRRPESPGDGLQNHISKGSKDRSTKKSQEAKNKKTKGSPDGQKHKGRMEPKDGKESQPEPKPSQRQKPNAKPSGEGETQDVVVADQKQKSKSKQKSKAKQSNKGQKKSVEAADSEPKSTSAQKSKAKISDEDEKKDAAADPDPLATPSEKKAQTTAKRRKSTPNNLKARRRGADDVDLKKDSTKASLKTGYSIKRVHSGQDSSPEEQTRNQDRQQEMLGSISFMEAINMVKNSIYPNDDHLPSVVNTHYLDTYKSRSIKEAMQLPPQELEPVRINRRVENEEIKTVETHDLQLMPVDTPQPPVPSLAYGLERVLFNPGVYHLQDPRSRVFNFDPYLKTIMPVSKFDFTLLKKFVTSSKDEALLNITRKEKKKYTGSTSSMTSTLSHFHYLLSHWREINPGLLSRNFPAESLQFTGIQRAPTAMFLRWRDGVYAIDADKEYDTANVLSMLGQSMEKLLTLPTEEYKRYSKDSTDPVPEEDRNQSEAFHYTTMGDFLMRSQLDAHDPRIPGTGMFDLKTRAVVSIRMDIEGYEEGRGYQIRSRHGEWESFEREYYDMIRAAFLKYSLQVRMGRMDGIFVAFHNTERIFGFQYISLAEMDYAIHGSEDTTLGDLEFKASLELLNRALDRATAKFPNQSLRLYFETRGKSSDSRFMYIFAEPVQEKDIEKIQSRSRANIEEFENRVLGIGSDEDTTGEWEALQDKVQESLIKDQDDTRDVEPPEGAGELHSDVAPATFDSNNDEDVSIGVAEPAESAEATVTELQGAEEEEGARHDSLEGEPEKIASEEYSDAVESAKEKGKKGKKESATQPAAQPLLAMHLSIRNKVNGGYVLRPQNLTAEDRWDVEYTLADIKNPDYALKLREACQLRRSEALVRTKKDSVWNDRYVENLKTLSKQGRAWRERMDDLDSQESLKILHTASLDTSHQERWTEDGRKQQERGESTE